MSVQDDLDRVTEQLEEQPTMTLALHAYAAYKLLCSRRPQEVSNGSFEIFISDSPQFSEIFGREIPKQLIAKITVQEELIEL